DEEAALQPLFVRTGGRPCCSVRIGRPRGLVIASRLEESPSMAAKLPPGHGSAATVPQTVPDPAAVEHASVCRSPRARRRTVLFLSSLLLLHATNPLAWGQSGSALWFPPVGLGLVLIAWFGPRAALCLALEGL